MIKNSVRITGSILLAVICLVLSAVLDGYKGKVFLIVAGFILLITGIYVWRSYRDLELLAELCRQGEEPKADQLHTGFARLMHEAFQNRQRRLEEKYSVTMVDKQSRINALQSQINPHFLYNTLECIRGEALTMGCGSIAKMAQSLAAFFRYSISHRQNIVTLQEELANIQNYFYIQAFRFDNRFDFRVEAEEDDALMDCLIPKMTLQPIVENSIFHGLEPKSGRGTVTIRVIASEETISMLISDDGIGMSEDVLQKCRRNMEAPSADGKMESITRGNGIALRNVNQRLKITFGEDYGLQLYSELGKGTDVEILFPVVREREKLMA